MHLLWRLRWGLWWIGLAWPFALAEPLSAQPFLETLPFQPGEVLTYEVRLGPLYAGTQTLQVVEQTRWNGAQVLHVEALSRPSALLLKLYHFRDFKASYLNTQNLLPLYYRKELEDGKYRGYFRITFHREEQIVEVLKNEEEQRRIQVPPDVHDELSMLYFFRSKVLRPGGTYEVPLFNGEKLYSVTVRITGRERVRGPGSLGTVLVYRIEASDGFKMWLTADARRLPLRIEAPVRLFGTLRAELKDWQGVRTLPASGP